ncbi:MAG: chemotaxis protein CheW [Elusimicrobiaceae bacterium]
MSEHTNLHLVSFGIGGELFCANITKIQEIIRCGNIVKIPNAPDFIEGIINLRGKVIAVIDLKKRFGMTGSDKQAQSRIVVVDIGGVKIGLAVDFVEKVIKVEDAEFEKTPAIVSGINRKFILGVVKRQNTMMLVLDLDGILSQEEMELLKTVE